MKNKLPGWELDVKADNFFIKSFNTWQTYQKIQKQVI